MPGRLIAIEKLGTIPRPKDPDSSPHPSDNLRIAVFKIMLSDPAVVKMFCDTEENKNNEFIQKLAKMPGNDVEFYSDLQNETVDEALDWFKEYPTWLLGVMIASRSKKLDDMCTMCKDYEERYRLSLVDGCYKVPGEEDMGCANCAPVGDLEGDCQGFELEEYY